MPEEQSQAKAYIFSLYPEEDAAIQTFANAKCRGNRSEALRRMIAFASQNYQSTSIVTEMYIAHPESETR
jgi:hypothetical protein